MTRRYPAGIAHVIVNGVAVIDGGAHTGALLGRVLRRTAMGVASRRWRPIRICKPRIKTVGLDAVHVGREHAPESVMVGQAGCSMASRTFTECEPLHRRRMEAWAPWAAMLTGH